MPQAVVEASINVIGGRPSRWHRRSVCRLPTRWQMVDEVTRWTAVEGEFARR
jgi:hypothetical protein